MITSTTFSPPTTLPPLENGDQLTRVEFEHRYQAMPEIKKAELIEGIVYMASPVRAKKHSKPHSHIITWLGTYEAATPGVETLDNATVRLDADNEPQPDALLRIEQGGQSTISEDDYVEGAPELIVEIAASTASIDLHQKLKVYRRNQVQEYLVWRIYDSEFDWFRLNNGEYIKLEPDSNGIIYSQVFSGLWLDKAALLAGNLAKVLEVLQQGLASQEHQDFVQQLASEQVALAIFGVQNLGQTSKDRALNFSVTNAFQAASSFAGAVSTGMQLDSIDVEKSPFCRINSDCWDVILKFFDPENGRRAKKVYRFTVDVSDRIPVTLGEVRSWSVPK